MKFLQRGKEKRLNEGERNNWNWEWLKREINDRRLGDVIRDESLQRNGRPIHVACEKTIISNGKRGFCAIITILGEVT